MVLTDLHKAYKVLQGLAGVTQAGIADSMGVARQNYNKMIRKDQDMQRVKDIGMIADTMGYDVKIVFVNKESGKVVDVD